MPRAKKPAGTAVDPRNGQRADLHVIGGGAVERFEPPPDLCDDAVDAWNGFWDDRPSALLTPSSRVVLLRWVTALDRYLRASSEADRMPLVEGSQGQQVVNPLYKVAEQAMTIIDRCEKQLGIGGLYAASLGLAAISEARSLKDMNAKYSGGGDASESAGEDDDPRLTIVQG